MPQFSSPEKLVQKMSQLHVPRPSPPSLLPGHYGVKGYCRDPKTLLTRPNCEEMKLRTSLVLVILLLAAGLSAQEYRPQPGETVMKIALEGRGNLYIKLFTKEAPKATSHVMSLVRTRFYDGQKVFRAERSPRPFLIQMGAPGSRTKDLNDPSLQSENSGTRIPYENTGYKFDKAGMVGLSTQPGDRDSGDCLFHVVLGPVSFLDGNYTVIGQVVSGLDLLSRIEKGDKIVSITLVGG